MAGSALATFASGHMRDYIALSKAKETGEGEEAEDDGCGPRLNVAAACPIDQVRTKRLWRAW